MYAPLHRYVVQTLFIDQDQWFLLPETRADPALFCSWHIRAIPPFFSQMRIIPAK